MAVVTSDAPAGAELTPATPDGASLLHASDAGSGTSARDFNAER
jgi:hypothetical protein